MSVATKWSEKKQKAYIESVITNDANDPFNISFLFFVFFFLLFNTQH